VTGIDKLGVVLLNLGTPDEPSVSAVRRYLAEFLADPRVVSLPRALWLPILYLFILPFRPGKVVKKYLGIWGRKDSPLRAITNALATRTQQHVDANYILVKSAMTYGTPDIQQVLTELKEQGASRFLFLPLFPQYTSSTIAACHDQLMRRFSTVPPPSYGFISGYHDDPTYIESLAKSVRRHHTYLEEDTLLLFSFHGIPQAQANAGDPYPQQCQRTAELVAQALGLTDKQWRTTFQSRFGPAPWLQPYTDQTLAQLPGEGINRVLVVCPGFATECLETLEEIKIENRKVFLDAGGRAFKYASALNATLPHVDLMRELISKHAAVNDREDSHHSTSAGVHQ
jgi:protoporphyrin/coproporphyrin ferrochelatase